MTAKIVGVFLAVLLVGLTLPGCSTGRINELESQVAMLQTWKATAEAQVAALQDEKEATEVERDGLQSDLEDKITELNIKDSQVEEISAVLGERDAEIFKLEEEKAELQIEMEYLKEPALKMSAKTIGRVTFDELKELAREFFPNASRNTGSYVKEPYPLASIETLEEFLKEDSTNRVSSFHLNRVNALDELAFRLKDRWIRAGLPPHSLGLIKCERIIKGEKQMGWRNIFITIENDELVIYEVWAFLDKIEKIEEPNLETYKSIVCDTI